MLVWGWNWQEGSTDVPARVLRFVVKQACGWVSRSGWWSSRQRHKGAQILEFRRESGHRMVISRRAVSKSWSVLQKENWDHWKKFYCLGLENWNQQVLSLGGYLESLANSYKWSPSLSTGFWEIKFRKLFQGSMNFLSLLSPTKGSFIGQRS